jgi:hypothetical protein
MQIINLPTVDVDINGGEIFTSDQARAATTLGMLCIGVNPSVDVVLVCAQGAYPGFPGAVAGTVANSPWVCPAGKTTTVRHRGGAVKAISTAGTSTVKVSPAVGP